MTSRRRRAAAPVALRADASRRSPWAVTRQYDVPGESGTCRQHESFAASAANASRHGSPPASGRARSQRSLALVWIRTTLV
jgi:hypothetical protein